MERPQKNILADIMTALKQVKDPELGVSLVDLGLIYETSLSKEDETKDK
jgi:metal-sulfur cluster biosynthetic enzyme